MASRADRFFNGGVFHVFNKTVDRRIIFNKPHISNYFLSILLYYRSIKANIKYSRSKHLPSYLKEPKLIELKIKKYFKVDILAYCLMPNHFHLLIKQKADNGLVRYVSDVTNSVTRYYNISHERKGPLFLPQFKSKRILTREQLLHVSRYIHLNPYSSGLLRDINLLDTYPLSSFNEYIHLDTEGICNKDAILNQYSGKKDTYKEFVYQNAEYQKTLEYIKYHEKWL